MSESGVWGVLLQGQQQATLIAATHEIHGRARDCAGFRVDQAAPGSLGSLSTSGRPAVGMARDT
jgi:hypothetical protein